MMYMWYVVNRNGADRAVFFTKTNTKEDHGEIEVEAARAMYSSDVEVVATIALTPEQEAQLYDVVRKDSAHIS